MAFCEAYQNLKHRESVLTSFKTLFKCHLDHLLDVAGIGDWFGVCDMDMGMTFLGKFCLFFKFCSYYVQLAS